MVWYKEGMEIGYGIEKELCFHPDPRVLFSLSVKKISLEKDGGRGQCLLGEGT